MIKGFGEYEYLAELGNLMIHDFGEVRLPLGNTGPVICPPPSVIRSLSR